MMQFPTTGLYDARCLLQIYISEDNLSNTNFNDLKEVSL